MCIPLCCDMIHVCIIIHYHVSPARKNHKPRDQEHQREDNKQNVTCSRPVTIVKHLSKLREEKKRVRMQK